jgi:hypothetical protein
MDHPNSQHATRFKEVSLLLTESVPESVLKTKEEDGAVTVLSSRTSFPSKKCLKSRRRLTFFFPM